MDGRRTVRYLPSLAAGHQQQLPILTLNFLESISPPFPLPVPWPAISSALLSLSSLFFFLLVVLLLWLMSGESGVRYSHTVNEPLVFSLPGFILDFLCGSTGLLAPPSSPP
ncbi:hypothetical protein BO82DRAFT_171070 [Aspergillus uvarum CBS 121591]|uniref:Uncharacterized protein n=1 Tax=Aspergillus uvarum CBS 121591 TaxID=1448315 RepID=A0A319C284_9EURO|nr:hypothetical protein BO82DRAFT_171070 [Aspergillus uvarum CBS 121591]PYH77910.1 hypothetical protein BO82DRAFT_171070 [Aspergillus uvarum CBS 121591]